MNDLKISLNYPQAQFLAMPQKFKAFVAGFGCMRDSTLVVTERGAVPIADIDGSVPLLSWSEKRNLLELAPSSAAYPKGKANLYRVITQQGEFVASGFHQVFCADHTYRQVQNLQPGSLILSCFGNPLLTNPGIAPRLSFSDAPSSLKIGGDCLKHYADAARQYGQRLHQALDSGLVCAPSLSGVQEYGHSFYQAEPEHAGGPWRQEPARIHRDQLDGHEYKTGFAIPFERPVALSEDHSVSSLLEHILQDNQQSMQFLSSSVRHRKDFLPNPNSTGRASACDASLISYSRTESIISIEKLDCQEWYWDLSVLNNNNYVTIDGAIHHNSGKTWVGCSSLGKHFLEFPRVNAGYFAPTYAQIRDIFYPTVDEALFPWGLAVKIREGNKEVDLYQGRRYYGTIICRSMEKPETIIGFKIGKALVDEIDVLKSEKAKTAWRKIIARLRFLKEGLQNGIDVTTTPEGFKFVYQQFVEQVRENPELAAMYGLIQASTYDNEMNLPADYIPSLLASYPAQLIDAYIDGQFVNLKTGSVYVAYNRQLNSCSDTLQPQETLFIGMDFNVGKMAAITHVKRDGLPRAVDEIIGAYDTPDMVRRLKERYWRYENGDFVKTCAIRIYPDASGDNRKSVKATETDLALLRTAGFQVINNRSNPPVKDRINSMNGMFCNAQGERRYLVNHVACPTYTSSLEQQAWSDNGEPDKTTGHDHTNDAGGYFIFQDYPIIKRTVTTSSASAR